MLNIQVFSDLHMDINDGCQKDIVISPDADVIVFAGDLFNNAKKTVDYLYAKVMQLPDHQHIVYVFGNHEFYNCDMQTAINYAYKKMHHRLHFLQKGVVVTIENVIFFGDTFWTDFESEGSYMLAMHYAKYNMSDFSSIFEDKKIPRFITPERTVELHNQALEWFKHVVETNSPSHFVMVTHHAPCKKSVSPGYIGNLLNGAFVSTVIENNPFMDKVSLSIHGHVHTAFDYVAGETRVVCNPMGYRGFFGEGQDFSSIKMITLED